MSSEAPLTTDIQQLLGLHPSSERLAAHIAHLSNLASKPETPVPEVKSYSDAVYFNYYPLGLSLLFKPVNGYKPKPGLKREDLRDEDLVLDGIDLYHEPKPKQAPSSKSKSTYSTYPTNPFTLKLRPIEGKSRPDSLQVTHESTGKDFVKVLGEPDRKGGGAGPSSGSIGIWCEWSKDGLMVEFGGDEARGPQAWERGKDAIWKVITIFPPNTE
ncbi:hypothetical protein K474DRAFT_1623186 [Panus rudis PR-1116 ss-1]|nr:hypothetical protein K474DRAFT_1623186 [Panus rudis PR-1116 ss-1]